MPFPATANLTVSKRIIIIQNYYKYKYIYVKKYTIMKSFFVFIEKK